MIIGETMSTLRNIHDESLDLTAIPKLVTSGMEKIEQDRRRIKLWDKTLVSNQQLRHWVDGILAEKWGKKAACRALHICVEGSDVEIVDPFEAIQPSSAKTKPIVPVPGA